MIDNKDLDFIHYRPDISYKPKILSIVDADKLYVPIPNIKRLLDTTPSSVLGNVLDTKEMASMMMQRLDKCLEDFSVEGISFPEYSKNLKSENPDYEILRKFEDNNKSSEHGSVQAEMYPSIYKIENEMTELFNILNNSVYDGHVNPNNLKFAEDNDHAYIEDIVEKDFNNDIKSKETCEIESMSVITEIVNRCSANSNIFLKGLNGSFSGTINAYYGGGITSVLNELFATDDNTLQALKDTSRLSFKKTILTMQNDTIRDQRLNRSGMKKNSIQNFLNISRIRDEEINDLKELAFSIDTDYDRSPITKFVEDTLDDIEYIEDQYNLSIVECMKQIKLDELIKEDIINSLNNKKSARQRLNLISNVITEKKNDSYSIDMFINKNKLLEAGTICSN